MRRGGIFTAAAVLFTAAFNPKVYITPFTVGQNNEMILKNAGQYPKSTETC